MVALYKLLYGRFSVSHQVSLDGVQRGLRVVVLRVRRGEVCAQLRGAVGAEAARAGRRAAAVQRQPWVSPAAEHVLAEVLLQTRMATPTAQ